MNVLRAIIDIILRDRALKSSRPSNAFRGSSPSPEPDAPTLFIPPELLPEHCAILAPSGHGKTQTLQHLFCYFLYEYPHMSYWIIDSMGTMVRTISQFDLFDPEDGPLKDHIVIIDPEDPSPPALNLFHLGAEGAMIDDLFMYIFQAIDRDLTPQQSTTVTYLLRLMRLIPNATINTLRQVLDDKSKTVDKSPFAKYFNQLDDIGREFFENHFFSTGPMQMTRASISRRLFALLGNDTFRAMFDAPVNTFDALDALQTKKIVFINTSQTRLGRDSTILGRFFIALALSAAYRRPPSQRDPALIIIDEASQYFDHQAERFLSTARQFGLGMMAASQFLDQLSPEVKAAINGNTATKLAGPVSHADATKLAHEMHTDADFIRSMKKHKGGTEFAAYIRSVTDTAIKVNIPFGTADRHPKMTGAQYEKLRQINRERYGSLPKQSEPPPGPVSQPSILPLNLTVRFPDYDIELPGLLDSGAAMTTIPVHDLTISGNAATFTLAGHRTTLPIVRHATFSGFTNETAQLPIVSVKIRIENHEAVVEAALNKPGTTLLVGRNFMAGRILVEPKDTPW